MENMKRMYLSSLIVLVLIALMPFTALGKTELGTTTYICEGDHREASEAKCLTECKDFPYYAKIGECHWGWWWIWGSWNIGECVCYV
ncbi:hypothetical protein OROGR_029049 [Orobanche gracilis]